MKHIFSLMVIISLLGCSNWLSNPDRYYIPGPDHTGHDTIITIPAFYECPILEQPPKSVDTIYTYFEDQMNMVVYQWPCINKQRLTIYQIRWTYCGPWHRYEYRDSCH